MSMLRQCLAVSALGLSSLKSRATSALVIVVGMACVIGVLLSMLSIARGFLRIYELAGDPARAVVLSAHAAYERDSTLTPQDLSLIVSAPGIRRTPPGTPLLSAELSVQIPVAGFADGALHVRGIGPQGPALRPGFRMVSGHYFRQGIRELIVGAGAERAFGLHLGDRVIMPDGEWPIVGTFGVGGAALESEIVADATSLKDSLDQEAFNSALVNLEDAASFDTFNQWLKDNPVLHVKAERQSDYYRRTTAADADFFRTLAYTVGVIMAIGAVFGATKILYAVVSVRTCEIATLRALGFAASAVAVSVLLEGVLLCLLGASLGAGLAWIFFDGRPASYWNSVFHLAVTPAMMASGLGLAMGLALLAGALPALRAARLQVSVALRPE